MIRNAYGDEVRLTIRQWVALIRPEEIGAVRRAKKTMRATKRLT